MPPKKRNNKKKKQQATKTHASSGPGLPPAPSTSTSVVPSKVLDAPQEPMGDDGGATLDHGVPEGAVQAAIASAVAALPPLARPSERFIKPLDTSSFVMTDAVATTTAVDDDGSSLGKKTSPSTKRKSRQSDSDMSMTENVQAAISAVVAASKVVQHIERLLSSHASAVAATTAASAAMSSTPSAITTTTTERSLPAIPGRSQVKEEVVAPSWMSHSATTTAGDDDMGPPPPPKSKCDTDLNVPTKGVIQLAPKENEMTTQQGIMDAIQSPLTQPAQVHLNQNPVRTSMHRNNHASLSHATGAAAAVTSRQSSSSSSSSPPPLRKHHHHHQERDTRANNTAQQPRRCLIL